MRLSAAYQSIIRQTVKEIFAEASVRLFGSRTNDDLTGGDLDLLIESGSIIEDKERKLLQLVARLQIRLGDQPIDVLLMDPQTDTCPIHDEALRTGVLL